MTPKLATKYAALLILTAAPALAQSNLFLPRVDFGNIPAASVSAIVDVNGDGRPDIVAGAGNAVYLLLQNANAPGTFSNMGAVVSTGATNGANNNVTGIAAGDFDRDGKQDLVVATTGPLLLFLGNGNGTFQQGTTVSTAGYRAVAAADFNRDHKLDIVVVGTGASAIFLGDGFGGFTQSASLVLANEPSALSVRDFNNDDLPEILIGDRIFFANGDGTAGVPIGAGQYEPDNFSQIGSADFSVAASFHSGSVSSDIVTAILDGLASEYPNISRGSTLFNPVQLNLPTSVNSSGFGNTTGLAAGDFDFDGRQDLARFDAASPSTLNVFLGNGNGLFQTTPLALQACSATTPAPAGVPSSNSLTVGDLNGDGVPDIIASCNTGNTVSLFLSPLPSIFLRTSANPSSPGQSVTLTAVVVSPYRGLLYPSGYSVQFFDGASPLGTPVALSSSQASLTTSPLAQGLHYLTAAILNAQGAPFSVSGILPLVVSPSTCAGNVTGQLNIVPGGFRRNPVTGQFSQTVSVTNTSGSAITGPLSLALANLSPVATALNISGFTTCSVQPRAPVVDLGLCPGGSLAPGATLSATLAFSDPTNSAISYSPVALAGPAPR